MRRKNFKQISALFIILILFIQVIPLHTFAAPEQYVNYHEFYSMISDPPTSRFSDYFSPSTIDNGRIWVDKTVTTGSKTFYDPYGHPISTITSKPDEFLVTLSALSQSYSIDTVVEPTDTVFVIDVSASMYVYQMGGASRASVMVNALNNAIHTIMDANPNNRIAVVAYGGYASNGTNMSRSRQILKLGHYDITGNYLNISSNSRTITVNSSIPTGMIVNGSVSVDGATPTQRGIYDGARILEQNKDTQYTYTPEKGREITIDRRPVMVLLTDGEPTFGWTNYKMETDMAGSSPDSSYNHGDGNLTSIDMGTDLLTVLTASYWKQRVRDHYYGSKNQDMQFYTIGVGVSGVHAPSVMDPVSNAAANSQSFGGANYNMKTLLDRFVDPQGGQITFPALNKGSASVRSLVTIENTNHYVKSYDYTDGYYPADNRQALNNAFQDIAVNIITKGSYTTECNPARPDFSGYLTITDPIGQYMQFRGGKCTQVNGQIIHGNTFAMSITQDEGGPLWLAYEDILSARLGVSKSTASEIISGNIAGGVIYYNSPNDYSSIMRWYADCDTEFVGLYYDMGGNVLPPPEDTACIVDLYPIDAEVYNEAAEGYTNKIYMYLSVTTAIQPGMFGLKGQEIVDIPLIKGQQILRWYIPASLIPMRTVSEKYDDENPEKVIGLEIKEAFPISVSYTVSLAKDFDPLWLSDAYKTHNRTADGKGYYFYSNDWPFGGEHANYYDTSLAVFEPNKYNPHYYFTEDTSLCVLDGSEFKPAENYSPGTDYYWIKEYFEQTVFGYITHEYILVNTKITKILTDLDGKPYVPTGEHKSVRSDTIMKNQNLTDTLDYKIHANYYGDLQIDRLGNNGRLELSNLSDLTVHKVWRGEPLDSIWVQLYADGIPYRNPMELTEDNNWQYTWENLLTYNTGINEENQVSFIHYTVDEGVYDEGVFVPYSEQNPLEGYQIEYIQPQWNDDTESWDNAKIIDTAEGYAPPITEQEPLQTTEQEPPPTTAQGSPQTGDISDTATLWLFLSAGIILFFLLKKIQRHFKIK